MSLLSKPVLVDFSDGSVSRQNPLPQHAMETRQKPGVNKAVSLSGVGRVDWDSVLNYVADWEENRGDSDLATFVLHYRLGTKVKSAGDLVKCFLATNAKTRKPRKATGQAGQIMGLALFPHFYPNLLSSLPVTFLDSNGVVDLPQVKKSDPRFKQLKATNEAARTYFNNFDGTRPTEIEDQTGVPPSEQLNFCVGSSPACRSTCLVLSGNNPASTPAVAKKANLTQALLHNPELFVAGLFVALDSFSRSKAKKRIDTVVRLNMLSDIPWYAVCPEFLESLADPARGAARVYWYDYTKLPFWRSEEYAALGGSIGLTPAEVLDLTFSFSGADANTRLCREALDTRSESLGYPDGIRIAMVFAPADPKRRATKAKRTTWDEILEAGVQAGMVEDRGGSYDITLPELGTRELVDGDDSDYRIDDPGGCVVALNFKEPSLSEKFVPGIKRRVAEAREAFTSKVPTLRKNPLHIMQDDEVPEMDTGDAPEALAQGTLQFPMFQVGPFLIGPHVPTVLED